MLNLLLSAPQAMEIVCFILLGLFFVYAHKRNWVVGRTYGRKIPAILIGTAVSFLIPGLWIFAGTAAYVCFLIARDGLFSDRT